MPEIVIRPGTDADAEARRAVTKACWKTAYEGIFSPNAIDRAHAGEVHVEGSYSNRKEWLGSILAEIDGKVVGHVGLCTRIDHGVGEVSLMYVHPDCQGTGVGKKLWHAGIRLLQDAGCNQVYVFTLEDAQAWRFYEAMGCTRFRDDEWFSVGDEVRKVLGYRKSISDPATSETASD